MKLYEYPSNYFYIKIIKIYPQKKFQVINLMSILI